jgi:hypothetical protein
MVPQYNPPCSTDSTRPCGATENMETGEPDPTEIWEFRKLFSRIKIPGWLTVLLGLYAGIPDQESRIEFWFDTARTLVKYRIIAIKRGYVFN